MDKSTFNFVKKRALHSISVHEKFKNGTFKFDKKLMKELFDDSKLDEDDCHDNHDDEDDNNHDCKYISKVRIGKDYQVTSLPEPNEPNKESYKTLNFVFITILLCILYYFYEYF